ncbi:glycosyltransferase family 28 protein [Rhodobacteraceae bacterium NNCM2]|nr:glycosyltransferase family 28 protein [Coraliihabitans acroporae]
MIFLTVGTQLPFDRLVRAVDAWAAQGEVPVFGQISDEAEYRPTNFEWTARLSPSDFEARFTAASAVVSHAGTGTIISALTRGKPILIMPRRASLGEHRNEHQLATVERFGQRSGIWVAGDHAELAPALSRMLSAPPAAAALTPFAEPELVGALRAALGMA